MLSIKIDPLPYLIAYFYGVIVVCLYYMMLALRELR